MVDPAPKTTRQATLWDFPCLPHLIQVLPHPHDDYVTPPYADLPPGDLDYAIQWARGVLRWREGMSKRRPGRFNPPSMRPRRQGWRWHKAGLPGPKSLGIPPRKSPYHPLRLDLVPRARWRELPIDLRAAIVREERAYLRFWPFDHPAHRWAVPPRRAP